MNTRDKIIKDIQKRVPDAVDWMLNMDRKGISYQFPIMLVDGQMRFIVMIQKHDNPKGEQDD